MFTCGLRRSLLRPTSLPRSHFLSNPISPAISSQPFTSISDFNLPRVGFDTEFTLGKLGGPDKKSFGFADDNFEPEATPEHLQDPRTFTAKKKWSLCEDYAYAIAQLPSKAGNANSDKFDAPLPQAVPPAQVLATLNAVRSRWNDKFSNEAVPPIDMVRAACVVSLGVQEMQAFAELPEEKEEDLEKEEEGEDGEGGADIEAANSEEADGEETEAKVEEEEAKVEEEEEKEEEEEDNKSFKPTQKHYLNNDSFFADPPDYAALLKQYHSHDDPAESITSLRGRLGLFDKDEAAVAEALAFEKETEEFNAQLAQHPDRERKSEAEIRKETKLLLAEIAEQEKLDKRHRWEKAMNQKEFDEENEIKVEKIGRWNFKVVECGEEGEEKGEAEIALEEDDDMFASYTHNELVSLKIMQDANLVKSKRVFFN